MKQKLNLLACINSATNEYRSNGLSRRFKEICSTVVDSQISKHNLSFAKSLVKIAPDMDVLSHGKVVLEHGTAEENYDFARMVKGADTRAHRTKIILTGSVEYNYYAGKSVELKDGLEEEFVNKHGEVVSEYGGPQFNYNFINNNNISTLNRQMFIDSILKSGSSLYNLKVAKNIRGVDIEPHSLTVAKCGTAEENYEFLKIKGSNANRHLAAIIKSQDINTNLRCLIELPINPKTFAKHIKIIFAGTDNDAKYEVVIWAKEKKFLNQLAECVPEMVQFIKDVKANKILVGHKDFRFLHRTQSNYKL